MKRLSRRALLRGAGGVAVALPFLEVMSPRKAHAAAAPVRLFTHFTENGVVHPTWYPTGTEKEFTLNKVHKPFEAAYKQNLIIFDGLTITQTSGQGSAHMRAKTSNLTAWPNKGGNGRSEGQSIDQAIADKIQGPSRFRSIEAGVFVRGNFRDAMFFSKPGQAALTEDDPIKLFARIFSGGVPMGGGAPADPQAAEEFKKLWERRKSILDTTLVEYKRMSDRATPTDKVRLDNHVSAIRDLEKSLAPGSGGVSSMGCKMPGAPEIGDFVKESRAQQEILLIALACDLTRVANLHYMTNKVVFSWAGAGGGTHHDISHRQKSQSDNLPELDAINTWYANQVVYIADRLKSFADVDGRTMFDNTVIHWANELALGSHKFDRAPYLILAGKFPLPSGGFLQTGRYLKYPAKTLQSGLLCCLGQMFGLPITNFGHPMWHQGPLKGLL